LAILYGHNIGSLRMQTYFRMSLPCLRRKLETRDSRKYDCVRRLLHWCPFCMRTLKLNYTQREWRMRELIPYNVVFISKVIYRHGAQFSTCNVAVSVARIFAPVPPLLSDKWEHLISFKFAESSLRNLSYCTLYRLNKCSAWCRASWCPLLKIA